METAINIPATTNVNLKTTFSRPRLVNETLPPPPKDLPKPVPFACIIMRITSAIEEII